RTANRSLATDDHNVAWLDLPRFDGGKAGFLAIEYSGWPSHLERFQSCHLGHGAVGRQVAMQDHNVPRGMQWPVHWQNERLFSPVDAVNVAQVFPQGFAGYRQTIAMEQAGFQEGLKDRGRATGFVKVMHDVAASWLEVSQVRDFRPDAVKIGQ